MSDHWDFITAAYAAAAVILLCMIGAIVVDYRALRRALARLPARDEGAERS